MPRQNPPDAIIVEGKITNGDKIRSYWRDRHHLENLQRRATFDIIRQSELLQTVEDRLDNLEAISAEPGSIPRQYHDLAEQTRAQVLFLQKKVEELALRRAKKEQGYY